MNVKVQIKRNTKKSIGIKNVCFQHHIYSLRILIPQIGRRSLLLFCIPQVCEPLGIALNAPVAFRHHRRHLAAFSPLESQTQVSVKHLKKNKIPRFLQKVALIGNGWYRWEELHVARRCIQALRTWTKKHICLPVFFGLQTGGFIYQSQSTLYLW